MFCLGKRNRPSASFVMNEHNRLLGSQLETTLSSQASLKTHQIWHINHHRRQQSLAPMLRQRNRSSALSHISHCRLTYLSRITLWIKSLKICINASALMRDDGLSSCSESVGFHLSEEWLLDRTVCSSLK